MKINIENAFTYVKNDPQVVKKFIIGSCLGIFTVLIDIIRLFMPENTESIKQSPEAMQGLLLLVSVVLILMLISLVCSFFLTGYFMKNAHIRIKNPDSFLPEWNFGLLLKGVEAAMGALIYIIVLVLAAAAVISLFYALTSNTLVTTILSLIVLIPVVLAFIVVVNLGSISYAVDLRFASFFNFSRMKQIWNENIGSVVLYLVLMAGLSFLVSMISGLLTLTIIGIAAIPVLNFYQLMIVSDLLSQVVRTAPHFKEITGQEA